MEDSSFRRPPSAHIQQIGANHPQPQYGKYGWGFDEGRFRFVIFGPHQADSPEVIAANADVKKTKARKMRSLEAEHEPEPESGVHYRKNRDKKAGRKHSAERHPADHPPAHVHVFDLNKGRESTYELIINDDGTCSAQKIMPHIKEDGTYSQRAEKKLKNMIRDKHDDTIQATLDEHAAELAACWKQLYSPANYPPEVAEQSSVLQNRYDLAITERQTHLGKQLLRRREGPTETHYTSEDGSVNLRIINLPSDDKGPSR